MARRINGGTVALIAIAAVIIICIVWFIATYNGLILAKANVDAAWANVQTQYQRRADLIPNLVTIANKTANFQQETFTEITQLRSQWGQAQQSGDRAQMDQLGQEMGSALSRLLVVVENYPSLDIEAFTTLQAQVEGTENRVSVERTRYNAQVKVFNVKIKIFPTVLVANMFGFTAEEYFAAQPGTEQVPVVTF
ncbi:MAG: LemA family protein [archaeon]